MKKYDVIIAGASTTGSWFARQMAKRGFKVLMIEKNSRENMSLSYDIFHMAKAEMEKFDYPIPKEGDEEYAFEFSGGAAYSAYGHYPKKTNTPTVGMHKHSYILKLNSDAVNSGAQLIYEAPFKGFLFNGMGQIIGVKYEHEGRIHGALCSIVADCTGIPSAARTALPNGYGVENFKITPRDMFYVVLRYVLYPQGHEKVVNTDSYLQYKCWTAPQADERGGILGVGANLSFDYAEEIFKEFEKNVPLSPYTVQRIERGTTPYRRPPYSFVADGFIAMGDAACLTKPNNGEGCTSSIYQAEIAVDVISKALKEGGYLTRERLWSINKRYIDVQGKGFAALMAVLVGAASLNCTENEFFFENDIIFSEKMFAGLNDGISIDAKEILRMIKSISRGVAQKKIRPSFLLQAAKAGIHFLEMDKLYSQFPENPKDFAQWVKKADALWERVGVMADNCDEEIVERLKTEKAAHAV